MDEFLVQRRLRRQDRPKQLQRRAHTGNDDGQHAHRLGHAGDGAAQHHQHLCLDKGYDNPTGRAAVVNGDYHPHIRRIGEEKMDDRSRKTKPARRWVVERTLGWLNRCRAILVRYNKKARNYLGLIQLACILLWYRRSWRLANMR